MLKTRKTMVSWQAFPSLLPRAPLPFLSRLKLPFPKLPFPSLLNACHASYFNLKNNNSVPFENQSMDLFESANMFTWFTMSGLETTGPRLGGLNLANASSRFIESFFSVSNERVDGGEAIQKKRKEEELDGELENVDGVAELRKWTEAKTRSYEKKIPLIRWLNDFSYSF